MIFYGRKMKASVDRDLCIGCETCVGICPQVFEIYEGKSRPRVDTIPKEYESACIEAEGSCPVGAIRILRGE